MKTKICCIQNIHEAKLAISHGANALGFVGPMPSGPGIISLKEIKELVAQIPNQIDTFFLTSETHVGNIIKQHNYIQSSTIQIVDKLESRSLKELKQSVPDVQLVRVIHVIDESSIKEAVLTAEHADVLLLDSGNPNLKIKKLGGTGKTHNWEISREIVQQSKVPVYLAGGLNSENVVEAIREVSPFGVDVCSGVRTNGKLDESKLSAFLSAVRNIN